MFSKVKLLGVAAGAASLVALGLGGTAMASPAVVPHTINSTVLYTGPADAGGIPTAYAAAPCAATLTHCTDSMAGWYTNSFGDLFTQVDGTYSLNTQAQGLGISFINGEPCVNGTSPATGVEKTDVCSGGVWSFDSWINGALGLQLCNETTAESAQLGSVYLGDGLFATGYLHGTLYGLSQNPCTGGGVLLDGLTAGLNTTFTALGGGTQVAGDTIQAQIKDDGGVVLYTAALSGGVANYTYHSDIRWFYPNEAAAGLQSDTTGMSAPAINDVADFSDVFAVDATGTQAGFGYWNAVQVDGSQDGLSPALLEPTSLNANTGPEVCTLHKTWIPGHWGPWYRHHHHWKRNWHKGHFDRSTVCTAPGDVSSSFSIEAGTPIS